MITQRHAAHVLLHVQDDGGREGDHHLSVGGVIGRSKGSDLVLSDKMASRAHARLELERDRLLIRDLGSHNGTYVNGERIERWTLRPGDLIRIGSTYMEVRTVRVRPEPPAATPALPDAPTRSRAAIELPDLHGLPTDEYLEAIGMPDAATVAGLPDAGLREHLTRARRFGVVYGMCNALGAAGPLDESLDRLLEQLLKVARAEEALIALLDPGNGETTRVVARRRDGANAGARVSQTILNWMRTRRAALLTNDAICDERFDPGASIVRSAYRSLLCVPLISGDELLGVIQLQSRTDAHVFDDDDLEMVAVIAPIVAVYVHNARLFEAQRRTIEELRSTRQKLIDQETMAVLGRFAAGLAHEVRNLLNPLQIAEELIEDYPDDPRICEDARLISDAGGRLLTVVQDFTNFARGQSMQLQRTDSDVYTCLATVKRLLKLDRYVSRHRLEVAAPGDLRAVFDERRVAQVLTNLVRNAAQAMERRGTIHLSACQQSGCVEIDVADQGDGIPPGILTRLFQPFSSSKGNDGLGLGLYVCQRIIEEHGGTLMCVDTGPGGTTMRVTLPTP